MSVEQRVKLYHYPPESYSLAGERVSKMLVIKKHTCYDWVHGKQGAERAQPNCRDHGTQSAGN